MVTGTGYSAHAHTYGAGLPPGSDCLRVIAPAQRTCGAARGGGALVRGSPPGSGVRGRVAAAPALCQTTRTSECGSEVGFADPRNGRVKREPGSREAEEPGVGEQSRRGVGLPRGPRSWSREGRGAESIAGGWAQNGSGSRVQRISGEASSSRLLSLALAAVRCIRRSLLVHVLPFWRRARARKQHSVV